jgi:UDP-N-acetylglucosamine 2-epimerase (non-hydrolysing)
MKIITLCGTRPEIIRLSIIIDKLDKLVDHVLVYTNQNYDYNLSQIFFEELKIKPPKYYFYYEAKSFGDFIGNAMLEFEQILIREKPDKVLILGDTNSGLLAIVAQKYGIPVYHMEAGNRSYDERLPEEANRKIIDSVSKYNLPYTENSKQNLLREGYPTNFILKTGNPIYEVMRKYDNEIENSDILSKLEIEENKYVLVTAHRKENVDDPETLINIFNALDMISNDTTVIFPIHPRTKEKYDNLNRGFIDNNIKFIYPLGFFDFIKLEKNAKCVISDSGTVQEETTIMGVRAITIRESTERLETIECGSNILCGTRTFQIFDAYNAILKMEKHNWYVPEEYCVPNVSDIVIKILLGKV